MLNAVFVSDLHLNSPSDERYQSFLWLLKKWMGPKMLEIPTHQTAITHLFLLGDIFDLWIGSHSFFVNKHKSLVNEIGRLLEEGVEVHYFEGNHDLHLERFWQKRLGVQVHSEPRVVSLGNYYFYLEHGDAFDPSDKGYTFLRWFLRTPMLRFLIYSLPSFLVLWLGQRASCTSRGYTTKVKKISDKELIHRLKLHGERLVLQHDIDFIINGHVHLPCEVDIPNPRKKVKSINLGSWLGEKKYYLHVNGATVQIQQVGKDSEPIPINFEGFEGRIYS